MIFFRKSKSVIDQIDMIQDNENGKRIIGCISPKGNKFKGFLSQAHYYSKRKRNFYDGRSGNYITIDQDLETVKINLRRQVRYRQESAALN